MRLWSDSRGEGCVEGNPEAVASEEDLARRKRRWLKGMSFRHVVSRGLKTLEEERACWREALAERLEAAGRKHADAEAVADAAASEAERWRTAHWESLLEEGRVEALRSPSLEDKAWGFYAKWPSYAADAFMASHVQVFAETHARRQAQAHAEAALGLAPWVGRGVDAKAFCAWAGMPEDVARRFMQAVACTATQARVSLPPRSSSDDFAVQEQSTTE